MIFNFLYIFLFPLALNSCGRVGLFPQYPLPPYGPISALPHILPATDSGKQVQREAPIWDMLFSKKKETD